MYVVVASTDGKNINREIESISVGSSLSLDFGYTFRIDEIKIVGSETIVANANYVMRLHIKS
jgi:hypothetical protein